nr:DUF2786 domain-containing protein [Nocardioides lijunqiniae]
MDQWGLLPVPGPETVEGLVVLLQVAALLGSVPPLADSGGAAAPTAPEHPRLARVRALLAKAESTEYPEEAEALTAKAQELITRYALERLLEDDGEATQDDHRVSRRLIWLDQPYVGAKADLVIAVANANGCRVAVSEVLGFCVVVGEPASLHSVELLVTSLLVQATAALQRHGRSVDRSGVSRTRSFRRSFLMSYALRIGERLRAAASAVIEEGDATCLLPALRAQHERVTEAFARMVPSTEARVSRAASNAEGWVAGRAAADLALLDVREQVTRRR